MIWYDIWIGAPTRSPLTSRFKRWSRSATWERLPHAGEIQPPMTASISFMLPVTFIYLMKFNQCCQLSGHCHAPSCLSMELYNADTGMLLCRHDPVYGKTHQARLFLGNIQDYKIGLTWWGCFWAIFKIIRLINMKRWQVHDELGYVAIPPCLWGEQEVQPCFEWIIRYVWKVFNE